MAVLFFLIGIASLGLSFYFYTKKEVTQISSEDLNKQKGDAFEDYMIQLVAKQTDMKFLGKVSDYHKDGVSALENREPDLKFKFHNTTFAVQCKWRNSFKDGKIDWAKDYQVRNYKHYQKAKKEKVLVVIGIGGQPGAPGKLFLIPLFRLTTGFMYEDFLEEFEIKDKKGIMEMIKSSTK